MSDIIKTWPSFVNPRKVAEMFYGEPFGTYYFALGRGKPKQNIERLWFTYRGRILGCFKIERIIVNDGNLPRLRSLSGEESEWQIKPDAYVAICSPPCEKPGHRAFMTGFRGWRYFDVDKYTQTPESRMRL